MKSLPFFKGLSWLIFLNLLVKPVWIFLIDREVQNIVGHIEYGRYFAVLNLSFVLYFISDAGLSNMLNQRLASGNARVHTRQFIGLKFFLLTVFVITCLFAGWLTGITQWQFFIYVIAIQALNSLFIFLRSLVTAHQQFQADAWLSVADKFLMTVFCGLLIYTSLFGQIDMILFLQVQTACTAIAVAMALLFIIRKKFLQPGEREDLALVLKNILPFAVIILLMSVHGRIDGFLLERIHLDGPLEAGIYASAFRLLDAGNMVGYLAASFLVPFIARNRNENLLISNTIDQARNGLLIMGISISLFCFFYPGWIQQLLYYSEDAHNAKVISLALLVLPALYLVHVYGSALTASKNFHVFIPVLLISVFLNLVLNLLLIPKYGAVGCCYAAISSQYFCAIGCWTGAQRTLKINTGTRSIGLYVFLAIILSALFYFGKMVISNVWIILAIATLIVLAVLVTQIKAFKKYFISFN